VSTLPYKCPGFGNLPLSLRDKDHAPFFQVSLVTALSSVSSPALRRIYLDPDPLRTLRAKMIARVSFSSTYPFWLF